MANGKQDGRGWLRARLSDQNRSDKWANIATTLIVAPNGYRAKMMIKRSACQREYE